MTMVSEWPGYDESELKKEPTNQEQLDQLLDEFGIDIKAEYKVIGDKHDGKFVLLSNAQRHALRLKMIELIKPDSESQLKNLLRLVDDYRYAFSWYLKCMSLISGEDE